MERKSRAEQFMIVAKVGWVVAVFKVLLELFFHVICFKQGGKFKDIRQETPCHYKSLPHRCHIASCTVKAFRSFPPALPKAKRLPS